MGLSMEPGDFTQYCSDPLNHKGIEVRTRRGLNMEAGDFTQYSSDPLNHKGLEVRTRRERAWSLGTSHSTAQTSLTTRESR